MKQRSFLVVLLLLLAWAVLLPSAYARPEREDIFSERARDAVRQALASPNSSNDGSLDKTLEAMNSEQISLLLTDPNLFCNILFEEESSVGQDCFFAYSDYLKGQTSQQQVVTINPGRDLQASLRSKANIERLNASLGTQLTLNMIGWQVTEPAIGAASKNAWDYVGMQVALHYQGDALNHQYFREFGDNGAYEAYAVCIQKLLGEGKSHAVAVTQCSGGLPDLANVPLVDDTSDIVATAPPTFENHPAHFSQLYKLGGGGSSLLNNPPDPNSEVAKFVQIYKEDQYNENTIFLSDKIFNRAIAESYFLSGEGYGPDGKVTRDRVAEKRIWVELFGDLKWEITNAGDLMQPVNYVSTESFVDKLEARDSNSPLYQGVGASFTRKFLKTIKNVPGFLFNMCNYANHGRALLYMWPSNPRVSPLYSDENQCSLTPGDMWNNIHYRNAHEPNCHPLSGFSIPLLPGIPLTPPLQNVTPQDLSYPGFLWSRAVSEVLFEQFELDEALSAGVREGSLFNCSRLNPDGSGALQGLDNESNIVAFVSEMRRQVQGISDLDERMRILSRLNALPERTRTYWNVAERIAHGQMLHKLREALIASQARLAAYPELQHDVQRLFDYGSLPVSLRDIDQDLRATTLQLQRIIQSVNVDNKQNYNKALWR